MAYGGPKTVDEWKQDRETPGDKCYRLLMRTTKLQVTGVYDRGKVDEEMPKGRSARREEK